MNSRDDILSFLNPIMHPKNQNDLVAPLISLHDYFGELIIHNSRFGHDDEVRLIVNRFAEVTFLRLTSLIELIDRPHFSYKNLINVQFDINSIAGISRSILEVSLLTYFFLVKCPSREQTELSILFWKHSAINSRIKSFSYDNKINPSLSDKINIDKNNLHIFKSSIFKSTYYTNLSDDKKEEVINLLSRNKPLVMISGSNVKCFSWDKLINSSFSNSSQFKNRIYSLLSAHLHTNWISLTQFYELNKSDSNEMTEHVKVLSILALISCSMIIHDTCKYFDDNLELFKSSQLEQKKLIQFMNGLRGPNFVINDSMK